ncbi:EGF CA and hEGF and EGF domain containing protein [Trichuris trichiura]|uniref:EGF CA and hEGF and EGF domain containing protein n=1 Tax=Trichuris trichiura TaxID=36087 RepID=A0A077ZNV3_TRITR|nr:EGF CA and hEGF and EGF domain containing protein [Trichuris trichiura]
MLAEMSRMTPANGPYTTEDNQYNLVVVCFHVVPPPEDNTECQCDINEPIYMGVQIMNIDCGPFDNNCIYRRIVDESHGGPRNRASSAERPRYIVLDGARIVKRTNRVIKGTINYHVSLLISLGNGTYMSLNYTVKAFSNVEINHFDPFHFSHGDLLRLYRETRFPLCIYRAWDTVYSQYYPCRHALPSKYYRDYENRHTPSTLGLIKELKPQKEWSHSSWDDFRGDQQDRFCRELLCSPDLDTFPARTGQFCEKNVDECAYGVHECPAGTECRDTNTSYYCVCADGRTGINCTEDVDECEEGTYECSIHSTCKNTNGSYKCDCHSGYTGKYCTELIDYCIIYTPCQNGGTCHPLQNDYHCKCAAGYEGKNCTTNIDECRNNPCGPHGTCEDGINKYTCKCEQGYTGWNCDIEKNKCTNENLHCVHGMCTRVKEAEYKCDCYTGYTGRLCDEDINECTDTSICGWNGHCRNVNGSFKCDCESGFFGDRCEEETDECESNPCTKGGYCLDGRDAYVCICFLGYEGIHCEHKIDHCKSHECENEGTCVNLPYGYACKCPEYATGEFCEDLKDNCKDENQCGQGYCRNKKGGYECICDEGYTGKSCKTKIDRCADIECRNGGSCTSNDEDYSCNCPKGTDGFYCEITDNGIVVQIEWKILLFASLFLAWRQLY